VQSYYELNPGRYERCYGKSWIGEPLVLGSMKTPVFPPSRWSSSMRGMSGPRGITWSPVKNGATHTLRRRGERWRVVANQDAVPAATRV